MPSPRVFISSTYVDLKDARAVIESFFKNLTYETISMERGGIWYDHTKPLDESCFDAVRESDLMILIIGGSYGSSTSRDAKEGVKNYNSITRQEYKTAVEAKIPVFIFIKDSVYNEHFTYINQPNQYKKYFKPKFVDNVLIFDLIHEIKKYDSNNQIIKYETVDEILKYLIKASANLVYKAIRSAKNSEKKELEEVPINAYKLYYYRRENKLSLTDLARLVGVKRNFIASLENVNRESGNANIFRKCKIEILHKIEKALHCKYKLAGGQDDDYLSMFLVYYYANREKRCFVKDSKNTLGPNNLFPTKCVVFDFDGTLTYQNDRTTWELIWEELGYTINDCARLHRQFSNKTITHEEWCRATCEMFNYRDISPNTLKIVSEKVVLMPGLSDLLKVLLDSKIEIHILSGSIIEIINEVLGDLTDKFTHIQANSFKFSSNRLLHIESTKFDFEGKAEYLSQLIKKRNFASTDILFVGNSSNDRWASLSGVRTLCINPHFTDGYDEKEWLYCKRDLKDLKEILPYVNINPSQ